MKELSLNILDIAKNSVSAKADTIRIALIETDDNLIMEISDNGCGMKKDFLKTVSNPFSTTRTTRKVGMGIPLLKLAAEQCKGTFSIESVHESESVNHGTVIKAEFNKKHIDYTPLGDIVSTVVTLIQGNSEIRWIFTHEKNGKEIKLDTDELKAVLGDVPVNNTEVLLWIKEYLIQMY